MKPTSTPLPLSDFFPPDVRADLQAVVEALSSGVPLDPEIGRRIRERGARERLKLLETHGVQDIGVKYIRELRDGDDES